MRKRREEVGPNRVAEKRVQETNAKNPLMGSARPFLRGRWAIGLDLDAPQTPGRRSVEWRNTNKRCELQFFNDVFGRDL